MIDEYKDFLELRRWYFNELKKICMHNKCNYGEGKFELFVAYPDIVKFGCLDKEDEDKPNFAQINLDCFLIGPCNKCTWVGNNISETILECRKDLDRWIKEYIGDN